MKLRLFIAECMMLGVTAASACGPFYNNISYPLKFHFYQEDGSSALEDELYERNVSSWRQLTSAKVPSRDVEEAVYDLSLHSLKTEFAGESDNAFVNWIKRNKATDIRDFLYLAKEVEELRKQMNSPWYYPNHKAEYVKPNDAEGRLKELLSICQSRSDKRLADRYALQAIRILRALTRYAEGIDYYAKALAKLPQKNVMRQMALPYVAGFYMNLGDTAKAEKVFAQAVENDYFHSPTTQNISRLASRHPESDVLKGKLNDFVVYGGNRRDINMLKIADAALSSPTVRHCGDWIFLKAFACGVYYNNWAQAELLANQAIAKSFSDKRMARDARLFKICVAANNGNLKTIDEDLCWMLANYPVEKPRVTPSIPSGSLLPDDIVKYLRECEEAKRSVGKSPGYRQGVLFFVVPALIANNQTEKALLIANTMDLDDPYASTGFQFLMSCEPDTVIRYKQFLAESKGVFGKLRNKVRHDDDYLNDIIGTLYLRKGQYAEAVKYLKKVSKHYQRSTDVYKGEYLAYNPWDYAYLPQDKWDYGWSDTYDGLDECLPVENYCAVTKLPTQINAKLNFAVKMIRLQNEMHSSKDSDARSLARMRYAIGRYNSFNTCWALTQYWCGNANQRNYQPFYYFNDDYVEADYVIDTPKEMKGLDDWFEKEVTSVLGSLKSDAAKATANMMMRNYKTIAKHYPHSKEGKYLATHCDHWSDWL